MKPTALQMAALTTAARAEEAATEHRGKAIKAWPTDKPVRAFDNMLSQMWKNRVMHHANRSKHTPHIGKKQAQRAARQAARAAAKAGAK